ALVAEGGEIKVDGLARHPPGPEARDIHELQRKGASASGDTQPVSFACPAQGSPRHDNVVAEREALVVRSQIGKGSEVSFVSRPSCATTLDAQIEGHRLEITIFNDRGHARVGVAGLFGLAVPLEQAEHLFALHSPNLLCEVNARTPGLGPPPGRDCSCFIPIRTRAAVTSTAWLAIIAGHGFRPLTQKW